MLTDLHVLLSLQAAVDKFVMVHYSTLVLELNMKEPSQGMLLDIMLAL